MAKVLLWIRALRAPFFIASAMSVVVGSAAAWWGGALVDMPGFVLALAGVVALHAGANLTNDYFDHVLRSDEANVHYGPFSGGSRVIQEGLVPARHIARAATASFVIAFLCGAALWIDRGGWRMPLLGFAGLFAGYLYTAPSVRLACRGVGELVVGITFGPLVTMGSAAVQGFLIRPAATWAGIPVGLLVALILLVNEFPDFDADKAAGKKTLIVRLGRTAAVPLCAVLYLTVYAVTALGVALGYAPPGAIATFITLPLAGFVVVRLWRNRFSPPKLRASSAAGILVHLLYTAILAAAYLAARR